METLAGDIEDRRAVVVEFPDMDRARVLRVTHMNWVNWAELREDIWLRPSGETGSGHSIAEISFTRERKDYAYPHYLCQVQSAILATQLSGM